jgi:hypothetical protein
MTLVANSLRSSFSFKLRAVVTRDGESSRVWHSCGFGSSHMRFGGSTKWESRERQKYVKAVSSSYIRGGLSYE